MKKFTLLFTFFLFSIFYGLKSFAQGVAINTTGDPPNCMLDVENGNATTNNIQEILRITRNVTGGVGGATGVGASATFYLETATDETNVRAASIATILDVATAGSEDGTMTFSVVEGGTFREAMRIDGTAVGGSAGYVGINQTSPNTRLDVKDGNTTDNTLEILRIEREHSGGTTAGGASLGGRLAFYNENSVNGTFAAAGSVDAVWDVATSTLEEGSLILNYSKSGTLNEGLRVDGTAGYVGIGQTAPAAPLHVTFTDDAANTVPIIKIERTKKTGAGVANQGAAFQFFLEKIP